MKYDTVIFDLDGTLLNTLEDLTDSTNYALRVMEYPQRSIDEVKSFVGNGIRLLMERAVPENTSDEDKEKALRLFKEYYAEHNLDNTKPYDGVIRLVRVLKDNNIKTGIVSNKIHSSVLALRNRFFSDIDVAIGDMPGLATKPSPDSCYMAMRKLGSSKEGTLYVGDSDVDIATAKNAGLDCMSVLWGFRDKDFLAEHGAVKFAETPVDIEREVLG